MVSKTLDISAGGWRGRREVIPEIGKTNEMTLRIAFVHCLESFNAAVHGCMRIQVEPSRFSDFRRWSWEFRKAKCYNSQGNILQRRVLYRGKTQEI